MGVFLVLITLVGSISLSCIYKERVVQLGKKTNHKNTYYTCKVDLALRVRDQQKQVDG